jgi:hypothetical protein
MLKQNFENQVWRKVKITRDASANVKILKNLENEGLIEIHDVMLEGGRENKKVINKVFPIGVCNHSRWDESVWGSDDDNTYDEIREIIGKDKIEDAMYLEAHIRNGHEYFVTEDNDFLSKRNILKEKFRVNIITPEGLQEKCQR